MAYLLHHQRSVLKRGIHCFIELCRYIWFIKIHVRYSDGPLCSIYGGIFQFRPFPIYIFFGCNFSITDHNIRPNLWSYALFPFEYTGFQIINGCATNYSITAFCLLWVYTHESRPILKQTLCDSFHIDTGLYYARMLSCDILHPLHIPLAGFTQFKWISSSPSFLPWLFPQKAA